MSYGNIKYQLQLCKFSAFNIHVFIILLFFAVRWGGIWALLNAKKYGKMMKRTFLFLC